MTNTPKALFIESFFHCATCGSGQNAVGWTRKGIQVFCETCDKNIVHIDFKGQKVAYDEVQ